MGDTAAHYVKHKSYPECASFILIKAFLRVGSMQQEHPKNDIAQKGEGGLIHAMSIYLSSLRCSVKKMQQQFKYLNNSLLHWDLRSQCHMPDPAALTKAKKGAGAHGTGDDMCEMCWQQSDPWQGNIHGLSFKKGTLLSGIRSQYDEAVTQSNTSPSIIEKRTGKRGQEASIYATLWVKCAEGSVINGKATYLIEA